MGKSQNGIERPSAPHSHIMSVQRMRMLALTPEASQCWEKLLLGSYFLSKYPNSSIRMFEFL